MIEGRALDVDDLVSKKVQLRIPYFILPEVNDTLPLVLSILEKGDIQILATFNGEQRIVGRISDSAYNVDKLIRTQKEVIYKTESDEYVLTNVCEYLEVLQGWIL